MMDDIGRFREIAPELFAAFHEGKTDKDPAGRPIRAVFRIGQIVNLHGYQMRIHKFTKKNIVLRAVLKNGNVVPMQASAAGGLPSGGNPDATKEGAQ